MTRLLALGLLLLNFVAVFGQQSDNTSELLIIAGKGWGKVSLGATRNVVDIVVGESQNRTSFDDVYFLDYPAKGIQISFYNNDTLRAVFFYNGQLRYENFATFKGNTDKGIDWRSSANDVINAYGKPKEDHNGNGWRRLVFDGIDFRWENGVMVRIGVTEK